ncbi:MAG: adenylate/guanylate cyclase domain-containing protein [Nocardioides sp.]
MPSDNNSDADAITVVLADDNLIVREGVRALLARAPAIEVVGVAGDYDELVETATRLMPQVVVTDIRMPPTFQSEGIDAAREIRKRLPGTAIVVLSQFDSPEYVIELLSDGAAGYAYLLKDRVADGDRLARAIREVATGGSMLDPEIVTAMVSPARTEGSLTDAQEELLRHVAEGRPVKAIAAQTQSTPEAVNTAIESLFMVLAADASTGRTDALRRLRMLHSAILDREEQGQTLSRMLPGGLADKLRSDKGSVDRTERLTVTVLMSDVRGYSAIAETADPTLLANQLNAHRREMNAAIIGAGGTVMQYVGDAVMAVFGAPDPRPGHAEESISAAENMHARQAALDAGWAEDGLMPFGLGIGLSTGEVAAAYLGSTERVEYTVVGDVVNLAQRLQDMARPAGTTVASAATLTAAAGQFDLDGWVDLGQREVKGRVHTVQAFAQYPSPASSPES